MVLYLGREMMFDFCLSFTQLLKLYWHSRYSWFLRITYTSSVLQYDGIGWPRSVPSPCVAYNHLMHMVRQSMVLLRNIRIAIATYVL